MEPPAKRPRLGRPPRGSLPFEDGDGDEDELGMDPEEFAMKQDPEYRLEKSRVVAENKLKSAFERLFEKYGKDFGDTGDEINFYTDEIEVDNGHIASLPVAEGPGAQTGDDNLEDEDEERILHGSGVGSAGKPPGSKALIKRQASFWAVKAAGPAGGGSARLSSLLSPQFGLGRSLSFGNGTIVNSFGRPFDRFGAFATPSFATGPIDPAWATPELPGAPDTALSELEGSALVLRRSSGSYSLPAQTVVRKTLPADYGRKSGSAPDVDDDDLRLGLSEARSEAKKVGDGPGRTDSAASRPLSGTSVQPEDTGGTATNGGPAAVTTDKELKVRRSQSVLLSDREIEHLGERPKGRPRGRPRGRRPEKEKKERTFVPDSLSPEPIESDEVCASAPSSEGTEKKVSTGKLMILLPDLPTVPYSPPATRKGSNSLSKVAPKEANPTADVGANPASEKISQRAKETFSRNTLDPSYAFSDEEEFGLRKRKKPQRAEADKPAQTGVLDAADDSVPKDEGDGRKVSATSYKNGATSLPVSAREAKSESTRNRIFAKTAAPGKRSRDAASQPAMDKGSSKRAPLITSPAKAQQGAAPSTPQAKVKAGLLLPPSTAASSSKRTIPDSNGRSSIISLVSDDSADEDEPPPLRSDDFDDSRFQPKLPSSVRRTPLSAKSTAWSRPGEFPASANVGKGSGSRRNTPSSAGPAAMRSAQRALASAYSSPLAGRQKLTAAEAVSPAGSLIETPGGTMRRCGQDGFRCERNFCFRCTQ